VPTETLSYNNAFFAQYDFNIGRGDRISQLHAQVEDVKQIMLDNVEKVIERGERLDDLLSKTEDLESHVSII
jgi:vesicle-associated membrane protein 7